MESHYLQAEQASVVEFVDGGSKGFNRLNDALDMSAYDATQLFVRLGRLTSTIDELINARLFKEGSIDLPMSDAYC